MDKKIIKNKGLKNFERNTENPFLKQAVEKVQDNIVKKYKTASNTDEKAILQAFDKVTGEVLGHTRFVRQIEVDEDKFAKFYLSNFSAFFELKPSAIKVFGYILEQLIPNKDYFYIDMDDAMKYTQYVSSRSVRNGLTSLLENEIIARGKNEYHYFINPMVIFNGNRISFVKTYVKKKKKKVEIDPMQTNIFQQLEELESLPKVSPKEAF